MLNFHEAIVGLYFTANILYCLAYVVRDMALLRTITIIGALSTLPYFFMQNQPLWSAIFWAGMFIVINAYNLTVLLLRRRPVQLSSKEQQLHLLVFNLMKPRDMLELVNVGEWQDFKPGQAIVQKGQFVNGLFVLVHGTAEVVIDGEVKARLREGDFIGEMSFISGNTASADVSAMDDATVVYWQRPNLDRFYLKRPDISDLVQACLGRNMSEKLRRTHAQEAMEASPQPA